MIGRLARASSAFRSTGCDLLATPPHPVVRFEFRLVGSPHAGPRRIAQLTADRFDALEDLRE
jgi:hypothetical protein